MRIFLAGLLLVAVVLIVMTIIRPADAPAPAPQSPPVASPAQPPLLPDTPAPATEPVAPRQDAPAAAANPPAKPAEPGPAKVPPAKTFALFTEPVRPALFELASGALVSWREHAAHKPALVLFSVHPFLDPLTPADRRQIPGFVRTAPAAEVVRRGRLNVADPALLPPQTVSAAIAAGLIGEVVFVQPTTREADKVSLAGFQQRAFAAGFLTEQEALALQLKDGVISGTVRGLPFRCVHPDALPQIARPVIVHIDLGYFRDLFVNDVKTPLYNLLHQTAEGLRKAGWRTLAVTLSYSNQEAEFSLETRFLISDLATLLLHPEGLTGATPPAWKLRADARYARAMFAETTADEMTVQAVAIAPDDPDALYALSLLRLGQGQPDEGFTLLDRAVALDPGYALAYEDLAQTAIDKGRIDKAEALLRKAVAVFIHNPFLRITLADLLIQGGRGAEALPLLEELRQRPWEPAYHPELPGLIDQMIAVAKEPRPAAAQ